MLDQKATIMIMYVAAAAVVPVFKTQINLRIPPASRPKHMSTQDPIGAAIDAMRNVC